MSDNRKNASRPGTLRDKMMTALRTSGVGKFQKMWAEIKKEQVNAAFSHHAHVATASASVAKEV